MTHFADEKPEVRAKEVMVFFCRCSARQLQWLGLSDPGFRIFRTSHTGTKGDTVPSDGFVGEIPPVEHSGILGLATSACSPHPLGPSVALRGGMYCMKPTCQLRCHHLDAPPQRQAFLEGRVMAMGRSPRNLSHPELLAGSAGGRPGYRWQQHFSGWSLWPSSRWGA